MKLSDLPVELFTDLPNLLTGANGFKGFIESAHTNRRGSLFEQMVVIRWETGAVSQAIYPDDCVNVIVNLEVLNTVCAPFVQGLIDSTKRTLVGLEVLLEQNK